MGCCGAATRITSVKVNGRVLALPEVDLNFDGPRKDRSCRDVVFLIIFIAFCVFGIVYLAYAYVNGDLRSLLFDRDDFGNFCGFLNNKFLDVEQSGQDFTEEKYYDVTVGSCTTSCPGKVVMAYYCIPDLASFLGNLTTDLSVPLAPKSATEIVASMRKGLNTSFFERAAQDIKLSWVQILLICLVGTGLSIVIVAVLRFLAAFVVWITVAIIILSSVAATIYVWVTYVTVQQDINRQDETTKFLVIAICVTIVTVLLVVLLIAMRKRIKLVITLFKEAGKAVAAMPFLVFMPLWTVMILVLVCLVWVVGLLVIQANGEPVKQADGTIEFVSIPVIEWLRFYHLFGLFWLTQFIIACQHISIAGAVAEWYFCRDKSRLSWPILGSMKNLIKYHLGSAALGSLIIAIVQMVRALLAKLQKYMGANGPLGCLLKCCQCCLACFERFLKFLTRNAYIEIAIYGDGFCKAAQKAFLILTANAFRVAAINFVGDFVLFLAKLAVVVATGFIGYEIIKVQKDITYQFVPLTLALIFVALIVHCFVSVYEMTIDTLFICFCEDCSMNDGLSKPYFMSRGLMQFVENSKKALEQLEESKAAKKKRFVEPGPSQIGASAFPSQLPTPAHQPGGGAGMSPLLPAYQPNSIPPSPSKLF